MSDTAERTTHIRTCPLCEATCGLELTLEGNQVVRIRGDRNDVFSKGFICPKGSVLHHLHDDPDRLTTPLIKQPDGTHREATWDEAFAEVERLLVPSRETHGPQSTAVYIGNPNVHGNALFTVGAIGSAAGTRNNFSASTVDQMPREVANGLLYGDVRAWPVPDMDRTDLLVILGANPVVSGGSLATAPDWPRRIDEIRERGGRVVVIDPRHTKTAERAGEWIPVVPGTDALLLAAITTTVFNEGLADLGPAGAHCDRLEELRLALAPFTADAVAERTGIDADTIRALARDLAAADRAVLYGRVGLQTHAFGTMASWLTDIVNIVTGHLDVPGGQMFNRPAAALPYDASEYPDGFTIGRWRSRVHDYPEARGEFPVAILTDEIMTPGQGQVRSFVCLAGNPVLSTPAGNRLAEALDTLDCMVSVDIYLNETSRHAHVILPPPSHLERGHFDLFFYPMAVRNVLNWSPPTFSPEGPTEEDIHLRLVAIVAGMGAAADPSIIAEGIVGAVAAPLAGNTDPDEFVANLHGDTVFDRLLDAMLKAGPYDLDLATLQDAPHGIDLGALEPELPGRLCTPNMRINLLPALIEGDLSRLQALLETKAPDVVLIGRRQLRSNNSWMHNIRVLMKGRHDCTLLIHPDDAKALDAVDGDPITISNSTGSVTAPIELSADLMRGVVALPHGWGHQTSHQQQIASTRPGVNANELTDPTALDPLSGACSLNGIPVKLSVPT